MKTTLPQQITTIDEAKAFLKALHDNDESYHPEDNAHDNAWHTCEAPTKEQCDQLNKLMQDIYSLPGNESHLSMVFDPCEFQLELIGVVLNDEE